MRATFCRRAKGQALILFIKLALPGPDVVHAFGVNSRTSSLRRKKSKLFFLAHLLVRSNYVLVCPPEQTRLFKIERRQIGVFFARSAIIYRASTKKRQDWRLST